jgi:hypothetical protein
MGAFAANVQTALVPLALLALYGATAAKRSNVPQSVTRKNNVSSNKSKKGGYRRGGGNNNDEEENE